MHSIFNRLSSRAIQRQHCFLSYDLWNSGWNIVIVSLCLNSSFAVALRKQETIQWCVSQRRNCRSYSETSLFFLALQSCNRCTRGNINISTHTKNLQEICFLFGSLKRLCMDNGICREGQGIATSCTFSFSFPSHQLCMYSMTLQRNNCRCVSLFVLTLSAVYLVNMSWFTLC